VNIDELRVNLYCAAEVVRSRRRNGQRIPDWLRRHHDHLDARFRASMSQLGHGIGCEAEQWN
jgi:hypothetical protein